MAIRRLELESLGRSYPLDVPEENLLIYHEPKAPALRDPKGAIAEALAAPVEARPLREAARGAKNAAIIVDDWTRSNATRHQVAPIVLDQLNQAGIPDEAVTVVMARGLALSPSEELVAESFGPQLMARPVRRHVSALHRSGQRFLGISSYGTPVWIDRTVADADFVVGIGSVFPSAWGGWSGGAKIIVPGVASPDTIRHNHSMMIRDLPGEWDRPGLADREEIARMAGLDLLVNLVLTPQGEIAAVGAGDFHSLHRRMGQQFLELYSVEVPAKPDVVVTTVSWWQDAPVPMESLYGFTDHSISTLRRIAEQGATIILVGNLRGGVWDGVREYSRTVYTLEDLADLVHKGGMLAFVTVMFCLQLKMAQSHYRMILAVDGISPKTLADMGFETAASANEALRMATEKKGSRAKVAVLPALGCPNWPVLPQQAGQQPEAIPRAKAGGGKP